MLQLDGTFLTSLLMQCRTVSVWLCSLLLRVTPDDAHDSCSCADNTVYIVTILSS
jgi:hypothetical protein